VPCDTSEAAYLAIEAIRLACEDLA